MKAGALIVAVALVASSPVSAQPAPAGASACSGCHAPAGVGSPVPPIPNSAREIEAAMREYREGTRPATVMNRIATGFSEEEVAAIAAWLAKPAGGQP